MLALAVTNSVGVVLFGVVTSLWVRTEARHRDLEPLRRLGRGAFGLVAVLVGTPALVLMPLFWLDGQLPPEAGLNRLLGPAMAILLSALLLVVLANLIGALIVAGGAVIRSGDRGRR